jgi:two-component sensor histidine kinase
MKHAFTHTDRGRITVSLVKSSNQINENSGDAVPAFITLTVSDDGCGLPSNFVWGGRKSLGAQLIPMFVQQLNARMQTNSSAQGATFIINIPEHNEGATNAN